MELILQGWLYRDYDNNIRINETRYSDSLSEKIMDYFNYESIDVGLGKNVLLLIMLISEYGFQMKNALWKRRK